MVKPATDMMNSAPLTLITRKPDMLSTKCLNLGLMNKVWECMVQVSKTVKMRELCQSWEETERQVIWLFAFNRTC